MSQEYSASMAAKLVGITATNLKQWEKHFPELQMHQDAKGNRTYSQKEIDLLKIIFNLTKERGFTLDGARREWLAGKELLQKRQEALAQLQSLRSFLQEVREQIG